MRKAESDRDYLCMTVIKPLALKANNRERRDVICIHPYTFIDLLICISTYESIFVYESMNKHSENSDDVGKL